LYNFTKEYGKTYSLETMKFNEFKKEFKNFIVFSLADIKKIDPDFWRARLNDWQKSGEIKKLRRGYYIFADVDINENILFFIANKIYYPSYVSLESALSHYNLIPEAVCAITSVSSKKTISFQSPVGKFSYRRIRPALMFGYRLENINSHNCKIAEIEKTVLDYLYLNPNIANENDFYEWRFRSREFLEQANLEKWRQYCAAFQNKKFSERAQKLLKLINLSK